MTADPWESARHRLLLSVLSEAPSDAKRKEVWIAPARAKSFVFQSNTDCGESGLNATLDDYMAHMDHAPKVAGEDHVGVGSDVSIDPFDTSAKGGDRSHPSLGRRPLIVVQNPIRLPGAREVWHCLIHAHAFPQRAASQA